MHSATKTAPLRLLGYPVSNYVNIVHAALIEKGVPFELVPARASQSEAFLSLSPLGKIPVLDTPEGPIAETIAILEYLEDTYREPRLYPATPYERAKARQIVNLVQLYIEQQVRQLFPGVFFGGSNDPATVAAVRAMLERGVAGLRRLVRLDPFLLGANLGYADLFAYYCLDIAERVTRFTYGWSVIAEIDGLQSWSATVAERASSRVVMDAFLAIFPTYLEEKNAAYRPMDEARPAMPRPAMSGAA
jgi:glutathione S-transferase